MQGRRRFISIVEEDDSAIPHKTAFVGLSNILYSERFKESSKFFFRREPGKRAHR